MLILLLGSAGFLYAQNMEDLEVEVHSSDRGYYPNEPSICISKTNPNVLVAGANIDNHYVSTNSGKLWDTKTLKSSFGVGGDPVLHSDIDGNIYFVHLSRTPGKTKPYGHIDRIVIQTSTDDGQTFSDGSFTGLNGSKMQDKPWISTDDYSSQFKGNVYLTWTEFDKIKSKKKKDQSRIQFSSSADKGKTWSDAMTISDGVGDAVDGDHTLEGATTAVDGLGNIYCVWAGHYKLYFDKSTNGGKNWGIDKVIFDQTSGWAMDVPHVFRTNGMPFLVVDNSEGDYTGRLYLVWGDDANGDADVMFSYSDDQGDSWSQAKRVHNDAVSNGKSQYMPNVAIDPITGHLAVVYYDRRNSKNNVFNDVYMSLTTNGGESFREYRLNDKVLNHIGQRSFSGDYIDIDFYNGKISAIWSGFDVQPKVYNRTIDEKDLHQLSPIYEVGQLQLFHSNEDKKATFYALATVPCEVKLTLYKKTWFSKKMKEKSTQLFDIHHRPGLQGYGEIQINASQKRRLKIEARITDTVKPSDKKASIQID